MTNVMSFWNITPIIQSTVLSINIFELQIMITGWKVRPQTKKIITVYIYQMSKLNRKEQWCCQKSVKIVIGWLSAGIYARKWRSIFEQFRFSSFSSSHKGNHWCLYDQTLLLLFLWLQIVLIYCLDMTFNISIYIML